METDKLVDLGEYAMTPLIPIMLFGWVPFTVILFFHLKPHQAVLISVIGGWLLLPMTGYNVPGIPPYTKYAAISLGLILGSSLSGARFHTDFKWKVYDLPIIVWCLSPIPTSLTNQLGLYDGLAGTYSQIMMWGAPYLAGRIYFRDHEALRDLGLGIVIGGMFYAFLSLYEIRMSPQLSNKIYGFFPHDWVQHVRYGGWRPVVFMRHGLMVALWMAASTTVAFWLWRSRAVERVMGIPIWLVVMVLLITTVLCKSANGWSALAIGCGAYLVYSRFRGNLPLILLLFSIPFYIIFRISGHLPTDDLLFLAAKIFDVERTSSLAVRLLQEELFIKRAMESSLLGWGGYDRGWPVDPYTGRTLIDMVDALWIIILSSKGFLGLGSLLFAMLIGPWYVIRFTTNEMNYLCKGKGGKADVFPTLFSVLVIIFLVDCLFNAMSNPIYIMCSGAVLSWYIAKENKLNLKNK
jgi:hypothetical protein